MTGPTQSDVIVVLGAAVLPGGRPSPSLRRRVLHGVSLLHEGRASFLIVSGGLGKHPPAEAEVMMAVAMEHGVPASSIVLDRAATTTWESAVECRRIMKARDWSTAVVVSDPYHLPRALILFRFAGISAITSGPARGRGGTALRRWIYMHIREAVALTYWGALIGWSVLRNDSGRRSS